MALASNRSHVSMRLILTSLSNLTTLGVPTAPLYEKVRELGGDPDDANQRMFWEDYAELFQLIAAASGDPAIGLRMAEVAPPHSRELMDYLLESQATLGDAVGMVNEFAPILNEAFCLTHTPDGEDVEVRLNHPAELVLPDAYSDNVIAGLIVGVRRLVQRDLAIPYTCLTRPRPADPKPWRRFFKGHVEFSCTENGFRYPRSWLDLRSVAADPTLKGMVERQARAELPSPIQPSQVDGTARVVAASLVRGEVPTLEAVARELRVSSRTLRRWLRAEERSFTSVVEQCRQDMAKRFLMDASLSLEEVAARLTLSSASALRRAFKRWTGESPTSYRNGLNKTC